MFRHFNAADCKSVLLTRVRRFESYPKQYIPLFMQISVNGKLPDFQSGNDGSIPFICCLYYNNLGFYNDDSNFPIRTKFG